LYRAALFEQNKSKTPARITEVTLTSGRELRVVQGTLAELRSVAAEKNGNGLVEVFAFLTESLLYRANRIPELFRGVGKGIKEFKNATRDGENKDT